MKKTIMMLCCLSAGMLQAQDVANFTAGPRAGVNFAHFTDVDDVDNKTGLVAGVFMLYSFQEHFGISADLLYSMEGSSFKSAQLVNGVVTSTNVSTTLSYLRIPLQANLFLGDMGNTVRPKITLGPTFGFLLGVKNEADFTYDAGNGNMVSSTTSNTDKKGYNTTDVGAVIGAGANIRLAERMWLNADARYLIGASKVFSDNSITDKDVKNQNISLSVGIGFGIGGR